MNRAIQLQRYIPKSKEVYALNPITERWEWGTVTGTYQRDKIGERDSGFMIDFGDGISQEINQTQINL